MAVTTAARDRLRSALAAATEDQLVLDLNGIAQRYDDLTRALPGVRVRFAMKACPVDQVLAMLGDRGAGVDAASTGEVEQAIRARVPVGRIHYGNTVKSDRDIAVAYRLGIRDFATDNLQDIQAIAAYAPGSRVFCRIATDGTGALWGLSDKFGCTAPEAVTVLTAARDRGLVPAGLSLHVGSQQMTAGAWTAAFADLTLALALLERRGIRPDHVNLGGGLPAAGYLDRTGRPLIAGVDDILATIAAGIRALRATVARPLDIVLEPGRYLVADHGAIRAHVARLALRRHRHWLYLSCGKFNGLYETDQLRYRLEFPTHPAGPWTEAVVAGPTCDSDDTFGAHPVPVPVALASGDPVWILAVGAYSISYTTRGFNGFGPLPCRVL
jgi:ornithine decarboxylase